MASRDLIVRAVFQDDLTNKLDTVGKTAGAALAGGFAAAGVAVAAGIGVAIKSAADFDATLSGVAAVGGPAAVAAMDDLRAKALLIGKDTAFSAAEGAQALEELAKKGVSVKDMLGGAADAAVNLAAAGSISLPEAAAITATAMNQFKLSGQELPHVADLLAGASSSAGVAVGAIGESLKYVGPVAKSFGQSIDTTTTAVALLGKSGIVGSQAGTALRASLLALANPSKDAAGAMQSIGLNAFDARGKMLPLPQLFQQIKDKTAGLNSEAKASTLAKIFGTEAYTAVSTLTEAGTKGFGEMSAAMGKMTAADVAAARLDNLKGDVMALGGSIETAAISLGAAFQPALRSAVQVVNAFIGALLPMIDQFAVQFPAMFEAAKLKIMAFGQTLWGVIQTLAPILVPAIALVALTIGVGLVTALYSATTAVLGFALTMLTGGVMAIATFTTSLLTGAVMGLLSFVGTMVTTVVPGIIGFGVTLMTQGLGSALLFAAGLVTGPVASVLTFAGVLITEGIGSAVAYGISLLGMASGNAAAGASFLVGLIPGAIAAAAAFVTTTIPSIIATGVAFVAGLIPAIAAALVSLSATIAGALLTAATFLTTTVPAIIATGVAFLVTLVPAVWAAVTSFIVGIIPAVIAAASAFLFTILPAVIAAAGGFISMAVTGAVAMAGIVASAIAAGIGVVVAFWPIILVAGLIGVAIYLLYKNWSSIWGAIVKYGGMAVKAIVKGVIWLGKGLVSIVQKAGRAVGKLFMALFGGTLKTGREFITKLAGGIRKGIAGMASKVMEIIGKLGEKIWAGLKGIVDSVIGLLKSIPGVDAVLGAMSNAGSGVSKFIAGFKESFDSGGDEAGGSFVDTLMGSIDAGLESAGVDFSVGDMVDGMMPAAPEVAQAGAGAAAGGGGGGAGAGAAAASPTGVWSGTDAKGAWTIDPATGQKIYDAGSVGALQQQNSASDKAAKEAGKQAKDGAGARSGVGAAVEKNIAPKESVDLAKAFSDAIQASIAAMNELVAARIPGPDAYGPKLAAVRGFWLDVGNMFTSIYQYAAETDRAKVPAGALIKSDLEGIGIGADAMEKVFKSLESVTGFMSKLSELKKIPAASALAPVREFALAAVGIGKEISGLLDKAGAELLSPVADAVGKMIDALSKTVDLLSKPIKGQAVSLDARNSLIDMLKWVGGFAYELTAPLMDKADESVALLKMSQDVMTSLGAGVDLIAKAVALLTGDLRKVKPLGEAAMGAVKDAVMWIGGIAYSLTIGLMADSATSAVQLGLAKEVFASLGAGMDMVSKAVSLLTGSIKKLTMLPEPALDVVDQAIAWIGQLSWRLVAPLLKDADASMEALKLGREVMGSIGAGLDMLTKALAIKLDKVVSIPQAAIDTALDNVTRIIDGMRRISEGYFDATGALVGTVANLKPFGETVGVAVDLFTKIIGMKLGDVIVLTSDVLGIVETNMRTMIDTVGRVALAFWSSDDEQYNWVAPIKEFADKVTAGIDLFVKVAGLTVDLSKVTAITREQYDIVGANILGIVDEIAVQAGNWVDIPDYIAPIKAFAETAGEAIDLFTSVASIAVNWAKSTVITKAQYDVVGANILGIVDEIAVQANAWVGLEDFLAPIKAFADAAGAAVGLFVDAAGSTVDWATVSEIPLDKLRIVGENIKLMLAELQAQLVAWTLADGTLDPIIGMIKDYAESAGAAVELITKGADLGKALAETTIVSAEQLAIAGQNVQLAIAQVQFLASGFDHLDEEVRAKLFEKIKSYSESASTAVELILKGASLSEAMKDVKPIGRDAFRMVADHIKFSIEELAAVMKAIGADVLDDARRVAETAGPVADAIGKVLDAFSIEKLMGSKFIDTKMRSAGVATRAAQTRAQNFANQVKAGIQLIFKTLAETVAGIGAVDTSTATHINALVAAYNPLIDMIARMAGLTVDLAAIRKLAQVPGILAGGLSGGGSGASGGAPGAGGGTGPILLTGPCTITGPVTFQGTQVVEVYLDGKLIDRTVKSGSFNNARNRAAAMP